jgi:hypothetical protein
MTQQTTRGKVFPLLLVMLGVVLLVGAGAWFFVFQPQSDTGPAGSAPDSEIPYPEIPRVPLAEAKAAFDHQTAVFVDVRGETFYQQSHIAGARSLPEDQLPDRLGELDPQDWIITYCT